MKKKQKGTRTPSSMIHKCWDFAHPATSKKETLGSQKIRFKSRLKEYTERVTEELRKPLYAREDILP